MRPLVCATAFHVKRRCAADIPGERASRETPLRPPSCGTRHAPPASHAMPGLPASGPPEIYKLDNVEYL